MGAIPRRTSVPPGVRACVLPPPGAIIMPHIVPLDLLKALFLGLVEGFTEFLPVSSTGHLLLIQHFLGFDDDDFGKTFTVLIQLGAILAILSIYFVRLWKIFIGMFSDAQARR